MPTVIKIIGNIDSKFLRPAAFAHISSQMHRGVFKIPLVNFP
jgi:hypothetical protein